MDQVTVNGYTVKVGDEIECIALPNGIGDADLGGKYKIREITDEYIRLDIGYYTGGFNKNRVGISWMPVKPRDGHCKRWT